MKMGLIPAQDSQQMVTLRQKLAELKDVGAVVRKIKAQLKTVEESEGMLEDEVRAILEECGLDSIEAEGMKASISPMFSISMPPTPADKERFFSYLKERELFESLATINSNSLRSWFTTEVGLKYPDAKDSYAIAEAWEADQERPVIPGMEHVRTFNKLKVRETN